MAIEKKVPNYAGEIEFFYAAKAEISKALGACSGIPAKAKGFVNCCTAKRDSHRAHHLDALCACGLLMACGADSTHKHYRVTESGCQLVGLSKAVTKRAMTA